MLVAALKAAGAEMLRHDPALVETSVKSTAGDVVTAADLACEQIIIDTVVASFPDDVIISEETEASHDKLNDDSLDQITTWVVDPIDGTNNFKHGMAYSCVSIGYVEKGVPVLGGIFDPYRNLLYLAEAGHGATCNGKSIHVSDVVDFDPGTRVCTGNNMTGGGTQANLARYAKLGHVWVDVLSSGVLIMADIAAGRLDLFHHNGLKPWDNAAGFLVVIEAGGKVVGLHGQPVTWLTPEAVLGNPKLVDRFIGLTS